MQFIDLDPKLRLVHGRHGWFLVNRMDRYIGRSLELYGEYCQHEWNCLQWLLAPGLDAIEVGANIGAHTVALARLAAGHGARVMAIEPQPVIFQHLCANLALNGLHNVTTLNCACGEAAGLLGFDPPDYGEVENFGGVVMRAEGGSQTVPCHRLDDLVERDRRVGLLKIDVEGFELQVLKGAGDLVARHRPVIYLENESPVRSPALIDWLRAAGYKLWFHVAHLYHPDSFSGVREDIFGTLASVNMLAVPQENPLGFTSAPVADRHEHPLLAQAAARG